MSADFHGDYRAIDEFVLCAPWMVEHMRARAERMKAFAEGIAPFDVTDHDGEHYNEKFEVDAYVFTNPKNGKRRASGVLRNTSSVAVFVEFGNVNTPEHATLRKALDAAG